MTAITRPRLMKLIVQFEQEILNKTEPTFSAKVEFRRLLKELYDDAPATKTHKGKE